MGPGELVAILGLALVVVGPDKLPHAVRTAGRVMGELRRISASLQQELRDAVAEPDPDPEPEA